MFKTCFVLLLFTFSFPGVFAQCISPLPAPDCTGTEPALADNETLGVGTTKWYYGPTTTMNSLTLDGGTLVVCSDLTIDKFYMTRGTIFIRPGARFVISSGIGSGLILNGNSYIYNYGTCEIQRNLSFDAGATAANPNVLINAIPSAVFRMSNQYFVINAAHSYFVNNGNAEFWGIITDAFSTSGSVCLGEGSSTRMAVLINKIADTYRVPSGSACLNVYQFSQFNNKLTADPGLLVCLGSSHSSFSGCGGCPANNWGSAQVFTNCAGCSALTVLGTEINSFNATRTGNGYNKLEWIINNAVPGSYCRIQRSKNGIDYQVIDSVPVRNESKTSFHSIDKNPIPGNNYYMINYIDPAGISSNSKAVKVFTENSNGFSVYPTPFRKEFFIKYTGKIEQVILTDMTGTNIPIRYSLDGRSGTITVRLQGIIQPGIYIVHLRTEKNVMARTLFKE